MVNVIKECASKINDRLEELTEFQNVYPGLKDAMRYSVLAGGKRLRPLLHLLANELLGGNEKEAIDIACAIEIIHTYSLIHDDLPAMDNDELRRGKPTNHVMFGEAFAILAGDGLLNYAYELMIANAMRFQENIKGHLLAINEVAKGAGVTGMISGQCSDIENEGQILTELEIMYIHERKTGALIKASLLSGIMLNNPNQKQIEAICTYGDGIGLSFQIVDDILDITGNEKKLGKSVGKDKNAKKFTYPTLFGLENSRQLAKDKTKEAIDALEVFGNKADKLKWLANYIIDRDR